MVIAALLSASLSWTCATFVLADVAGLAGERSALPTVVTAAWHSGGLGSPADLLNQIRQLSRFPATAPAASALAAMVRDPSLFEQHRPELEASLGPAVANRLREVIFQLQGLYTYTDVTTDGGAEELLRLRALYDGRRGAAVVEPVAVAGALSPVQVWPAKHEREDEQRVHVLGASGERWLVNSEEAETLHRESRDGVIEDLVAHPQEPGTLVRIYHSAASLGGFERKTAKVESLAALSAAQAAPPLLEHGEAVIPGRGRVYFYAQERARGRPLSEFGPDNWPRQALDALVDKLRRSGLRLVLPAAGRAWLLTHLFVDEPSGAQPEARLTGGSVEPAAPEALADHSGMLRSMLGPPKPRPPASPAPAVQGPGPKAAAEASSAAPDKIRARDDHKGLGRRGAEDRESVWIHLQGARNGAVEAVESARKRIGALGVPWSTEYTDLDQRIYYQHRAGSEEAAASVARELERQVDVERVEVHPAVLERLGMRAAQTAPAPAAQAKVADWVGAHRAEVARLTPPAPARRAAILPLSAEDLEPGPQLDLVRAISDHGLGEDEAFEAAKRLEALIAERPQAASEEAADELRQAIANYVKYLAKFDNEGNSPQPKPSDWVAVEGRSQPTLRIRQIFDRYRQLAAARPDLVSQELGQTVKAVFSISLANNGYYGMSGAGLDLWLAAAGHLVALARTAFEWFPDRASLSDLVELRGLAQARYNELNRYRHSENREQEIIPMRDAFGSMIAAKSLASWPAVVLDMKVDEVTLARCLIRRVADVWNLGPQAFAAASGASALADFSLAELLRAFRALTSVSPEVVEAGVTAAQAADFYKLAFATRAKGQETAALELIAKREGTGWQLKDDRFKDFFKELKRLPEFEKLLRQ